ncbi:pectin acetylesterase 5-like isoform X2 [Rhodamnia argentea]|uniref:Pectin acetylesterase n=1 Tax=Rhodamnia argentea TaxID=178133 RepID=A0ABM3GT88_9MYRT|nr:pectin acetylesterase 5-like isoform X2 [Rhodamnia argentea]
MMANTARLRPLAWWWKKWTKRDWAIAAVAVTAFLFLLSSLSDDPRRDRGPGARLPAADLVDLTLLRDADAKGALCLDGSAPGYHFSKGFGSGFDSWLIHIEGGGWCDSLSSCLSRAKTKLGSSAYMEQQVSFSGILSSEPSQNPEFFNWNKVKIRYCDGASFSGHPQSEPKDKKGRIFFRGQLIWKALMDELLSAGLSTARQAFLTGCSAGGLATLIHCDDFRKLLPKDATVKCLADAGFFLNEKDVSGKDTMRSFYHNVVQLQGVQESLNKDCVASKEPSDCFFPKEIIKTIRTPVFLVNPAYDFWQIQNVLVPEGSDPSESWKKCRLNIRACTSSQLKMLQEKFQCNVWAHMQ